MISGHDSSLPSSRTRAVEGARPLAWGFLAGGLALLVLSAGASARMSRDVSSLLDREDTQALEQSQRALDGIIDQKLIHLKSEVAVLAEDARIRSTVVTPEFDETSVADVLTELKKSARADVLAILDAGGRVRSVTGADEMKNLDLGTSSLVKAGLEGPAAYVWTFTNKVRLLGVAPILLGDQVLAMFMMGFDLGPSALAEIGKTLGAAGGVFAGEVLVASSSHDTVTGELLEAAASKEAGTHELSHGTRSFVARISRPSRAAGAVKVVWTVEKHHEAARMRLLSWFSWAPVALVGLSCLLLLGLALRARARAA
jgi:hypothetical protein